MSIFDGARIIQGRQGPPGGATVEQIGDLDARVEAIEDLTIPTVLNDLSNVSGTPSTGDLLQYTGSGWEPYTPEAIVIPFAIPFSMGTGSSPVPTSMAVPWQGIVIPFACTITGYAMDADNTIAVQVQRALAATPQTYATISGSETPTISSGPPYRTSDTDLTTWTTAISAMDRLRVITTGTPVAWSATLTLFLKRTL